MGHMELLQMQHRDFLCIDLHRGNPEHICNKLAKPEFILSTNNCKPDYLRLQGPMEKLDAPLLPPRDLTISHFPQ